VARPPNRKDATALQPQPAASPNPTIALETSDLVSLELAEARVAEAKPNATIALETQDLVEVRPGETRFVERIEPSIVIEGEPEPVAAPAAEPPAGTGPDRAFELTDVAVPRIAVAQTAPQPAVRRAARPAQRSSGWLVVFVYVVALAALAFAIYERFFQ